jgi:hypothetical protein
MFYQFISRRLSGSANCCVIPACDLLTVSSGTRVRKRHWLPFLPGVLSMAPTPSTRGWRSRWLIATSATLLRRLRRSLRCPRLLSSVPGRSPPPPPTTPDPKPGARSPPSPASEPPDSRPPPPASRPYLASQEAGHAAPETTLLAGPGGTTPAALPAAWASKRSSLHPST